MGRLAGRGAYPNTTRGSGSCCRRDVGFRPLRASSQQAADKRRAAATAERTALHDQMAIEAASRKALDDAKAAAKAAAQADMFATFAGGGAVSAPAAATASVAAAAAAAAPSESAIFVDADATAAVAAAPPRALPPPRAVDVAERVDAGGEGSGAGGPAVVPLSFTARLLPTPLRESKVREENEWLARNLSHRAAVAAVSGGKVAALPHSAITHMASQAVRFFQAKDFASCLASLQALQAAVPAAASVASVATMTAYCTARVALATGAPFDVALPPSLRQEPATLPPVLKAAVAAVAVPLWSVVRGGALCSATPPATAPAAAPASEVGMRAMASAILNRGMAPTPTVAALLDVAGNALAALACKSAGNDSVRRREGAAAALAHYRRGLVLHPTQVATPALLLNASKVYADAGMTPHALRAVARAARLVAADGVRDGEVEAGGGLRVAARLGGGDDAVRAAAAASPQLQTVRQQCDVRWAALVPRLRGLRDGAAEPAYAEARA